MAIDNTHIRPGRRVRVLQQIPHTVDPAWTSAVEGVVTRFRQAKTGSWFAHARDDRLWLDRLELRKDDGELVTLVLDQYSVVEPLDSVESDAATDPDPEASETFTPPPVTPLSETSATP